MLGQVRRNRVPEWIKTYLHAFRSRKLEHRDYVFISGDNNEQIRQPLYGDGGNIKTDFHIHSFLFDLWPHIEFNKFSRGNFSLQEQLGFFRRKHPIAVTPLCPA